MSHAAFPGRNGDLAYVEASNSSYVFGEMFRVRQDGRRSRRLRCRVNFPASCKGQEPVFSPTGRSLAFVSPNDDLTIGRSDGTRRRRLNVQVSELLLSNPAWSPRGRNLLLEGQSAYSFETRPAIYTIAVRGGGARRLIENAEDPAWSSRGSIAFVRDSATSGRPEIWVARGDGRKQRRVTRGAQPTWAPGGRRLAFTRFPTKGGESRLFTVRPSGGGIKLLNRVRAESPAWSPDGRRIAFLRVGKEAANDVRRRRIYSTRASGGGTRAIGASSLRRHLDWQPRP